MASILFLSKHGDGVPLALRMASEGNIVKMWIKEESARASLDGYKNPSKVSNPRVMIEQYDLVLSDMVGLGAMCEEFSRKGKLVLGGGQFADKVELDREYGEKVAKSLMKTKVPATATCESKEELAQALEQAKTRQAIKPLGNKAVNLTLVSNDDLNRPLKGIVRKLGHKLTPCIMQEVIDGVEVSTEGWFNGREWVRPFNHTMEKKRFMPGDVGSQTGCMGNVVWLTEGDKLTKTTIEGLAPLLERVGYIGPIDINCIVTEQDAYFLEATSRMGYDAIQALAELIQMPLFDFFYKIATRQTNSIPTFDNQAMAVRLSVPPYPTSEKGAFDEWRGIQVLDLESDAKKHVWLSDVMKDEDVEVLAGVDGVIGCVTARGSSVRECQRRVYRTIKNIVLHKDVQYRIDIGDDVDSKRQQLKDWGWVS